MDLISDDYQELFQKWKDKLNRLIDPSPSIKDDETFSRVRILNSIVLICCLLTISVNSLLFIIRLLSFQFTGDLYGYYYFGVVFVILFTLYILGRTKYYSISLILFPVIPLIGIWFPNPIRQFDATTDPFLFYPIFLLIMAILTGSLLYSRKEFVILSIACYFDIVLYSFVVGNSQTVFLIIRLTFLVIISLMTGTHAFLRREGFRKLRNEVIERKRIEEDIKLAHQKLDLLNRVTLHDLLNQVISLQGFTDFAKEVVTISEVRVYLERIEKIAKQFDKILNFTRNYQEIGVQEVKWKKVYAVFQQQLGLFNLKDIEITMSVDDLEILADPLLEKAFFILIDNSFKHAGKDLSEISLYYQLAEDDRIIVFYEDNGVGIVENQKELIFDLGYGKIHGYGLFLAREILSMTNITIIETGKSGSRFEISIPASAFRLNLPS